MTFKTSSKEILPYKSRFKLLSNSIMLPSSIHFLKLITLKINLKIILMIKLFFKINQYHQVEN